MEVKIAMPMEQFFGRELFLMWYAVRPLLFYTVFSQSVFNGAYLSVTSSNFQNRSTLSSDVGAVSWGELAHVLRHKFAIFTGAQRAISDSDLSYMAEKLMVSADDESKLITLHNFAKVITSFLNNQ